MILLPTLRHLMSITGQLSRNNPHLSRYLTSFPSTTNIVSTIISFFYSLLFYMEGNQTRFVESRDSDIKTLVVSAVPESNENIYINKICCECHHKLELTGSSKIRQVRLLWGDIFYLLGCCHQKTHCGLR